ncbi:MAG: Calx-beta domain-containing protein, partial [Verrucomicrobiota bacterium]
MKKFTSPGLKNLTGSFHLLVAGVMTLVVMTANISRAQATATIPSGTFQFTTGNYNASSTDGDFPLDTGLSTQPSLLGVRVTVTRSEGSSGRVLVPVVTTVMTNISVTVETISTNTPPSVTIITTPITSTNVPVPETTNTLVFDDYQMSGSILLPPAQYGTNIIMGIPVTQTNANVTVTVTNTIIIHIQQLQQPTLDPMESPDLMAPELGFTTNETGTVSNPTGSTGITNTASVIGFERATFRIDKDKFTNAVIFVIRSSNATATTPDSGATVNYLTDPVLNTYNAQSGFPGNPQPGNTFNLEAGSDYALPNSDFTNVSGTLTFPANVFKESINIPIGNNGTIEFNKDIQVALWIPAGSTEPAVVGPVDTATVTILSDSLVAGQQPAGAVDRTWNADNSDGSLSSPPFLQFPGTDGGEVGTANGNGGTVYAVVEQTNDEAIIAGSFNSFDSNPYNFIARLLPDGYQDPTFLASPNSGANDVINAMVLQPDGRIIIGGNFTAFNGANRQHIARLNTDGSVDTTFNPGTGVNGQILSIALETNGQIVVAGDFTAVDGTNINSVARLNANGSLDASFNPGAGPNGVVNAVVVDALGRVIIGGDFDSVDGNNFGGVARLNVDGTFDPTFGSGIGTFNPNSGSTDPVYALAMQGSQILVGGSFAFMELANYNGLVRLNPDGTVDTTFNPGSDTNNGTFNPQTGLVDSIFAITLDPAGNILIGGDFTTYNQTRRVGIARLFSFGSLDTSFMDTAYNQFAGLINHYHNPNAVNPNDYPEGNQRNYVSAIAVEPTGSNNVIIGGNFLRVGGGSVYHSGIDMFPISSGYFPLYPDDIGLTGQTNSGIFANGRMDIHPRSNVARLIGGSTPGPGNITLVDNSYSVNKTAGTLYVSLTRTNGSLGVISATCEPEYGDVSNAGIASTNDVTGGSNLTPTWPTLYSLDPANSWTKAPGFTGPNFTFDPEFTSVGTEQGGNGPPDVRFNIINNTNITGNLSAKIDLSAPNGSSFALGGESIPLGAALGSQDLSPLTLIDTVSTPGVIGFSSSTYTANQGSTATITLTRTNGTSGTVQISYSATDGTATNGTAAVSPGDFTSVSGTLTFGAGVTSQSFTVPTVNGTSVTGD